MTTEINSPAGWDVLQPISVHAFADALKAEPNRAARAVESKLNEVEQLLRRATTADAPNQTIRLPTAVEPAPADDAFLLALLNETLHGADFRAAAYCVVNRLKSRLQCDGIALGVVGEGRRRTSLVAVSDIAKLDDRAAAVRAIEHACDETLARDREIVWPPVDPDAPVALTHKRLAATLGAGCVVTAPMKNALGESAGVWLFYGRQEVVARADFLRQIARLAPSVAAVLSVQRRAERGRLWRTLQAARKLIVSRRGWCIAAAVAAMLLALLVPCTYKVGCPCDVEPVSRRYIAAPFDGTLEKTLVEPGDLVVPGQVLARIDGRENRWEQAGLRAELEQAGKRRDAALAKQDAAAVQVAQFETQRLEQEIHLIERRGDNLEIKAAIGGIVVSGDLQRAEGAPLTVGQSLFEIAPMGKMIVELAIPEEEIAYVAEGCAVEIRVTAFPDQVWHGTIARIHPRSELREQDSVFIADVPVDDSAEQLRPGMNGRARIITAARPLGWNLFHRPWYAMLKTMGW